MAVTFAVGAVTGTVLSFEFGLLWPRFMGRWGDVFGVPFAFEGIFFFTEAIFVSDLHLRMAPTQNHHSQRHYGPCAWAAGSRRRSWR